MSSPDYKKIKMKNKKSSGTLNIALEMESSELNKLLNAICSWYGCSSCPLRDFFQAGSICFLVLFSHFCPYRCATFTIISSGFHVSLVTLFSRGFSVARWAKESLQIMLWNPHIGHPRNLWTSWNLYRRWPGLICLWMHAIIIIF